MATQRGTLESWLEFTLSNLRERLRTLKAVDTGELLESVKGVLIGGAGDDVQRLTIAYAIYGKYVDMGVGRGMGAGVRKSNSDYARIRDERGQLYKHSRKERPWSSKELGRQSVRLGVLLSEYYGKTTIVNLTDALPASVEINL
ncbi:hypothetical protein Q5H92_22955 [Hymenobacter sp. M29]|uniref:Uncharacterized protein n=1 Tax=Hymenobacter mellowenesis TaxID=3063995 RepID=A0ABT9AIN5_9BACT|nr:hypothetical protein [Hymenobacter sp. M29]MDO7849242.1 hypothetical protein [Hymenobacter sp. M29]